MNTFIRNGVVRGIRWYRIVAPWVWSLGGMQYGLSGCRHIPSCSRYAEDAVQKHGIRRGVFLAVRRLLSCHPFATVRIDS